MIKDKKRKKRIRNKIDERGNKWGGREVTSLGPSSRREDLTFIPIDKIQYFSK